MKPTTLAIHLLYALTGSASVNGAIYISVDKTLMMKYKARYLRRLQKFCNGDFTLSHEPMRQASTPLSMMKL